MPTRLTGAFFLHAVAPFAALNRVGGEAFGTARTRSGHGADQRRNQQGRADISDFPGLSPQSSAASPHSETAKAPDRSTRIQKRPGTGPVCLRRRHKEERQWQRER